MPLDSQAIYVQLGRLVEQMPELGSGPPTQEVQIWLGRLHAILTQTESLSDIVNLNIATKNLINAGMKHKSAHDIKSIAYRALYTAELNAPVSDQGTFIAVGNVFNAMVAIAKILSSAQTDVLIIDPYMDEKVLTDFALLVPVNVRIRLLPDRKSYKAALVPLVQRWVEQHKTERPLEVRLTPARALHDRLIIVDSETVWILTQSLNKFADRSPASIVRSGGEAATLKLDAYKEMWDSASIL